MLKILNPNRALILVSLTLTSSPAVLADSISAKTGNADQANFDIVSTQILLSTGTLTNQ
jgi:hypothetical protein